MPLKKMPCGFNKNTLPLNVVESTITVFLDDYWTTKKYISTVTGTQI